MKKKIFMAAAGIALCIALVTGSGTGRSAACVTGPEAYTSLNDAGTEEAYTSLNDAGTEEAYTGTDETDTGTEESNDNVSSKNGTTGGGLKKKIITANQQFSVSAACGIEGNVLYNSPTQVDVSITCTENFTGALRLIPGIDESGYYNNRVGYEREISLSAGSENTFVFTPSDLGDGNFIIQIIDDDGDIIYSEQDTYTLLYAGDTLNIGILSDDYMGLSYIDGITVNVGSYILNSKLFRLSAYNMPDESDCLRLLNYIVIDNFDTASLSEEQYQALKDWVYDGGILVCALGANYQNVLHIFDDDFISGDINGMSEKDITWRVTDINGMELNLTGVYAVDFNLTDGYPIIDFSETECSEKNVGQGAVVLLSYSMSQYPVSDFDYNEELMSELVTRTATQTAVDNIAGVSDSNGFAYYSYEIGEMMSEYANETSHPSASLMLILFIAYALIAGPAGYLVMKKLNKREFVWIYIPAAALVFVGIVFLIGNRYNVKDTFYNTLSVVTLNGDASSEVTYTDVVCPAADTYSLLINKDYDNLEYYDYDYDYDYYGNSRDNDVNVILSDTSEGRRVTLDNSSVFKSYMFGMEKTGENTFGSLDEDIKVYSDGFEGSITNNTKYDLTNVVVLHGYYYMVIENLKAGESVEIRKDDLYKNAQLMNYQFFYEYYGTDDYGYYYDYYEEDENYYNSILSNYIKSSFANDSTGRGYIWGVAEGYTPEVFDDVDNKGGRTVLLTEFDGDYADTPDISYSQLENYLSYSTGSYDSSDGEIYDDEVYVEYNLPDDVEFLKNESYNGNAYYYGSVSSFSNVYAYNVTTGEYEMLFTDSDTINAVELQNYVSDGVITLQYTEAYTFMPVITVGRRAD